ncbi:hypothetical protein [Rubripirellula reticaptiva]|uniref:Replication protein n=1 Tax=Rubripirellula reticaptiva TaxID=2528013 RepID=A0A5C6ES18_9BACT|nr:hypothetical protein [Rubripirellula reticaptiva]TWU51144.1 hypothetical protein Poly59_27340 [Rubripirellula reticaptiva]
MFAKLFEHSNLLEKNIDLSGYLRDAGDSKLAKQIKRCGTFLSGNRLYDLKQEHYCGQTAWCHVCAAVLAAKRADQWMRASEMFGDSCHRSELTLHNFLIKPATRGGYTDSMADFRKAVDMLRAFRLRLKYYHDGHLPHRVFEAIRDKRTDTAKRLRKQTFGPTISSIHLVPDTGYSGPEPFAHMHLAIATCPEMSKRAVGLIVNQLWDEARIACKIRIKARKPEVNRTKDNRPGKDSYRESTAAMRLGRFDLADPKRPESEQAVKNFTYLGQVFKTKWTPKEQWDAHWLLDDVGMKPKQLIQTLCMMEAKRGRLPSDFPARELAHKYEAEYTEVDGWQLRQRIEPKRSEK